MEAPAHLDFMVGYYSGLFSKFRGPFQKRFDALPKFDGVDKFQFHNLNLHPTSPKTGMDYA